MIWLLVIVPLAIAIAGVLLFDRGQAWLAALLAALTVFFLLLIRWFMALDIEVEAAAVRAAFGPFHKAVPIAQILSVSEELYRVEAVRRLGDTLEHTEAAGMERAVPEDRRRSAFARWQSVLHLQSRSRAASLGDPGPPRPTGVTAGRDGLTIHQDTARGICG